MRQIQSKPFYLNTLRDTPVRFDLSKFMNFDVDSYDVNTAQIFELLKNLKQGGVFKVQGQDSRPDLISNAIYGDTQYWWVLLLYNGLTEASEVAHAQVLNYPSLQDLEDIFFSLKIDQTKADK